MATMIPCTSPDKVPDYCLQYYTTSTGTVKSFDFGGQQQNNQHYTVCVKPNEYYSTSVKWTPCSPMSFDIVSNFDVGPHSCNTDWIQVKGEPKVCEPFYELISAWKPYELLVNFDETEFPPLPSWNMTVDPLNCEATCGVNDSYDIMCECLGDSGTNQTCQCAATSSPFDRPPDVQNTGFCLNYIQI